MGFYELRIGAKRVSLALAAVAIPLIVHFTFRARPRTVDLGSIRFLQEIIERSRNRKKVMRWLLLALRMACIVMLVLLFARPYLPERVLSGDDSFVAVLVDDSASMRVVQQGDTAFARAQRTAAELLEGLGANVEASLAFFNDRVEPQSLSRNESPAASAPDLAARLDGHQPSFGVTDYAAALRWASDICQHSTATTKHVHLITDLQQSGLEWSEAATLPAGVVFHLHDVGRQDANNLAVTSAVPERPVVRPNDALVVTARISNSGPFTLEEAPVTLELHNGNRALRIRCASRWPQAPRTKSASNCPRSPPACGRAL